MENYEISRSIETFSRRLEELKVAIDIDGLEISISQNEAISSNPSFYEDMTTAQKVLKNLKNSKDIVQTYNELEELINDLKLYFEMQKNGEASIEELDSEITQIIKSIEKKLSEFEQNMLLSDEYDSYDALIELHPGAGGTESQDWTEMIFRMYKRYADSHNYSVEVLDYLEGDETGIKSVTFMVKGNKAYGYLKSEHGVHRLVRISPFDSGARRHTSFCGCSVTPVITDDISIDIHPDDIRVDTYRSSGAGGQYVNTTDSAVRITHIKSGIVVTCQNQRSQIQNREKAMEILRSKLYQLEREENDKKLKNISGNMSVNGFSGQIRSYVFHPYSLVKDHRTDYETANVFGVMDGDLDGFINAYLKMSDKE